MTTIPPVCLDCIHFISALPAPPRCKAFPAGIPVEIWEDGEEHTAPRPDDNGLQFKSAEEVKS